MATLVMVKAMFKRYAIELRRYWFNTLSMLVSFYLIFILMFYGIQSLAEGTSQFGGALNGMVVGFMVFYLTVYAYAELSWVLVGEASQGTLEQLSMSPLGFGRVLIARIFAALVFRIAIMFLLLLLMMWTTGQWLHFDLWTVIPLLLFTMASVQGIGFVMGGLALVFKQVQAALGILQFLFVGLIAAPIEQFPVLKLLPLSWGTRLIGDSMINGTRLWNIPTDDLLIVGATGIGYFTAGFIVFKFLEHMARDRGLLGHY
jgi:ABC-2 type transport system permease protein